VRTLGQPSAARVLAVDTQFGLARAHLYPAAVPRGLLVLGHGAGGGVDAPDLVAVAQAVREDGMSVALVEQPYRVAGRRAPAPARQLDIAWSEVVAVLRLAGPAALPLIAGGRSSGARVACRTATAVGASAVLCLAFPLQPPGSRGGREVASRLPELDAAGVPVLVVQGDRDPFGLPPAAPQRTVVRVPGDDGLKADLGAVTASVLAWLAAVLG